MIRGEAATGYEPEQIPAFAQWGVKGFGVDYRSAWRIVQRAQTLQIRLKGLIGQSLRSPQPRGAASMVANAGIKSDPDPGMSRWGFVRLLTFNLTPGCI